MTPFLRENSVVTVKKVLPGSLRFGDMILFEGDRGLLVFHRVVGKCRDPNGRYRFQTKGDAVKSFDAPVLPDRLLGKVYQIKKAATGGQLEHIDPTTKAWIVISTLLALASLIRGLFEKVVSGACLSRSIAK
jgi:signal peptidase I